MLPDGTLLLDRYRTIRLIGEGGFGEVYLAEDTLIQRNVAVKVIKPQQNPNKLQEAMRLFQREMKAIARLDHPHILPLYDFGEATVNGTKYAFMVMPYREDGTLETWLDERRHNNIPFPSLQDVAQILYQAASALQHAHNDKDTLLHLDVKPANFLIRDNKENPNCPYLLLADFGIAKFVDASAGFSTTVRGSIEYMPSEQSRSNPQCASDQYALAIMIYKFLTYQLPFKGDYAQLLYQHLEVLAKPPSTLNPHIPPEIDAVILKALAKDYEERYPTIIAFANAFKQALVNNASTRVILSISKTEAETGGSYPLKLSNGRQITVAIPPGIQDGQKMRQEGLGIPTYDGGPIPALIITVIVKPESESERKIAAQLQSLEQEVQALRTNPPTDQKLEYQIQQLSQNVANSQAQASSNDQDIAKQLRGIANTIAALQANQGILKQVISNLQANLDQPTPSPKKNATSLPPTPTHDQEIANPFKLRPLSLRSPAHDQSVADQPAEPPQESANLQSDPKANLTDTNTPFSARMAIAVRNNQKPIIAFLSIMIVLSIIIGVPAGIYQYQQDTGATATANAKDVATANVRNAATATAKNATATIIAANPYPSYLPSHGKLALFDPLNGLHNNIHWDTTPGCSFTNSVYHVTNNPQIPIRTCTAASTNFSNFAFTVTLSINTGDCGGVSFREDNSNNRYDVVEICSDGTYAPFDIYSRRSSGYINKGLRISNVLTVFINGPEILFYVNQHMLDGYINSDYSQGQIGFLAGAAGGYYNVQTDVSYTNAKIWTL